MEPNGPNWIPYIRFFRRLATLASAKRWMDLRVPMTSGHFEMLSCIRCNYLIHTALTNEGDRHNDVAQMSSTNVCNHHRCASSIRS